METKTPVLDLTQGEDGVWRFTLPQPAGVAKLEEKGGFMNAAVLGIPLGQALIGVTVAEASDAVMKMTGLDKMISGLIPGGSTSPLGSINIAELLEAVLLGWLGKNRPWTKAGALALTVLAFQPMIASLLSGLIGGTTPTGSSMGLAAGPAADPAAAASEYGDATSAAAEQWLKSGA